MRLPLVFMGCPWDERATHTFSLFLAKHIYTCLLNVLQCYFSTKTIFFETFGNRLLRQGRSLRFRSKPERCTYRTPCITCVEFQRSKRTRMWFCWDLFWFFSCIFLHQNVSVRPPSFSPILYIHMFEHVYVRNMQVDLETMHHTWSYAKSQFL